MVIVEIASDAGGELRAFRATLSRVPVVGETIRVLWTINGGCVALGFQVLAVVHNAATAEYPPRGDRTKHGPFDKTDHQMYKLELDAWLECEFMGKR